MKQITRLTCLVSAISTSVIASPSTFFSNPVDPMYFTGPLGQGILKVCTVSGEPISRKLIVPEGTLFADQGPIENYEAGLSKPWILTVVTTRQAVLKQGEICTVVPAHVEVANPPPAHPELKPVLRFKASDKRYFEVAAPDDPDAPLPNLAPWNADAPFLHAFAETDFR